MPNDPASFAFQQARDKPEEGAAMTHLTIPISQRDHLQGPATAPVTLLEYGDYECPYCGAAFPIIKQVQKRLGDQLRLVFRHFPLGTIHPHAGQAAEAAEAAGIQGKFWEMHDTLFEYQHALSNAHLLQYARSLNLDQAEFERDLMTHAFAGRVREDFLGGVRSGVNGTPTFFINGRRHDGSYDRETLLAALEGAAALREGTATL
jgi:protein-disulfide isomerase